MKNKRVSAKGKSIEIFISIANEAIGNGEYYQAIRIYQALLKERVSSLYLRMKEQTIGLESDECKDFMCTLKSDYINQSEKFRYCFRRETVDTCYAVLDELDVLIGQEGSITNVNPRMKEFANLIKTTFSIFSASCMRFKKKNFK